MFSWPDLKKHGAKALRTKNLLTGKKDHVIVPTGDELPESVQDRLVAAGFERKLLNGKTTVYITDQKFNGALLKQAFPGFGVKKTTADAEKASVNLPADAKLTEWVAPKVEVEDTPEASDEIAVSVFDDLMGGDEKPAEEEKSVAAPAPAREDAAPVAADGAFEAYLIHEGVPSFVREEFMAAKAEMEKLFTREELFDLSEKPDDFCPASIRKEFKERSSEKHLAKSKIIDTLYPFMVQFELTTEVEREEHARFVEEYGNRVDGFHDWMRETVANVASEIGAPANTMTKFDRNVRIAGTRTLVDMIGTGGPRRTDQSYKSTDKRFSMLPGASQFNNYKSGGVTFMRKHAMGAEIVRRFEQTFPELQPEQAPHP